MVITLALQLSDDVHGLVLRVKSKLVIQRPNPLCMPSHYKGGEGEGSMPR